MPILTSAIANRKFEITDSDLAIGTNKQDLHEVLSYEKEIKNLIDKHKDVPFSVKVNVNFDMVLEKLIRAFTDMIYGQKAFELNQGNRHDLVKFLEEIYADIIALFNSEKLLERGLFLTYVLHIYIAMYRVGDLLKRFHELTTIVQYGVEKPEILVYESHRTKEDVNLEINNQGDIAFAFGFFRVNLYIDGIYEADIAILQKNEDYKKIAIMTLSAIQDKMTTFIQNNATKYIGNHPNIGVNIENFLLEQQAYIDKTIRTIKL